MSKSYQTFADEANSNNNFAEKGLLIDRIMEETGYGFYQFKIIIITTILLIADGIQMNVTNNLFIPLKNLYGMNDYTFSVISAILFVGVGLGSILSGYICNYFGRKQSIIYSNILMFFFTIGMAFSSNYIYFSVCRFLTGFSLGAIIPMIFGILTEYLPIKLRSFVLVAVWAGFTIGVIYTLCMMLILTPNYETSGVRQVFIFNSVPNFIMIFICYFLLEESPRYLIVEHREEEGIALLEDIWGNPLSSNEKDQILREIKEGVNKDLQVSIKYLFNHDFLKTTIILIFIWMINSFVLYGQMFILQPTLQKIHKSSNVSKPTEVIFEQIVVQLISLPGNFITPIFSEIKFFGRKYSTALFYILGALSTTMACIFQQHFSVWLGFSQLCIGASFNISSAYTSEIYPTVIRETALGFFYFCTRSSGFFSQFLSTGLENMRFLLLYYVTIVVSLIGSVLICISPVETYGVAIDLPIINGEIIKETSTIDNPKKSF
jgi:MFS family permease